MNAVSEQRLSQVHPALAAKIVKLDSQLLVSTLIVSQGLRTSDEQRALYEQGRSELYVVNDLRKKVGWAAITEDDNIVVTAAAPGYSWHEFGLAVDVVPQSEDGSLDWNANHPIWREIITKGEALGLVSGNAWNDTPHFQMTGTLPVTPDDLVRSTFAAGGMQAVWQKTGIQV